MSWPRMFVFFRLMISPKSLQAWEKQSISSCSSLWLCVMTVASSANNMTLMRVSRTFVLTFRWARLKRLPSDLVCRQILSCAVPNACLRRRVKKIPKRIGASTQPYLTLLHISKGSERLPLNCTVHFMLEWKGSIKLCSLGGQPILQRALKRPSLLTRSKALVRLMNAMYRDIHCSLHFSWS